MPPLRAVHRLFVRGADIGEAAHVRAGFSDGRSSMAFGSLTSLAGGAERLSASPRFQPRLVEPAKINVADFLFYLFAADVIGAILAAVGVFRAYAIPLDYDQRQLWIGLGAFVAAWGYSASMQKLYASKVLLGSLHRLLLRAVATCAMAFGIILFLGFSFNLIGGVSRVWLLAWAASVFFWVALIRVCWRAYLRRLLRGGGCLERILVVAGSTRAAQRLSVTLARESGGHVGVVASVALPGTLSAPSLDWVEETVRGGQVDRVIVGRFPGAMVQANELLGRLTRLAIDVTVLPDLDDLQAPVLSVDRIGMLAAIDLDFRPLSPAKVRIKRVEDLVLAGLATIFVLPVLLLVSLAIKLDSPGPVLFRQKRAGFNDRIFEVWKFRTMHAHARDDLSACQTSRNDKRVTRIGRLLRRTSIDELPQLFNVLTGDMSIVGPRPHALGMTAAGLPLREVIEGYSARHRLKPGITGWAQVNGSRGEVDSHEKLRRRVALDCHYIENWSLGFDLWIIFRTAIMLLSDKNAY